MRGRTVWRLALLLLTLPAGACQSPTNASDTIDVDDVVEVVVTPAHAVALASTDGRTYRVVRGNNQPDDVLVFDWVTTFAITLKINSNATDSDVDLTFPIAVTSVTPKVQQATGGIVTPPTGGEVEHYESVLAASTGTQVDAINGSVTLTFQAWYDLPSLRREALITESVGFKDADGKTFTKSVDVIVDP